MDTIKILGLSFIIFSYSAIYADSDGGLSPFEEKLLDEREKVYGDPEEEREEYYEKVNPENIPKDENFFQKSHPLEEHPLEEERIPDQGIPENRIPSNPIK